MIVGLWKNLPRAPSKVYNHILASTSISCYGNCMKEKLWTTAMEPRGELMPHCMHEQKPPWLLLLPHDLRVDRNLYVILYNKLEIVSKGKLYSPHYLAAFIKFISAIYATKTMSKLALSCPQFPMDNKKDSMWLQQSLIRLMMNDSFQTWTSFGAPDANRFFKNRYNTLICQPRLHFLLSFSSWPTSHTPAGAQTLPGSPASPTNSEIKLPKGRGAPQGAMLWPCWVGEKTPAQSSPMELPLAKCKTKYSKKQKGVPGSGQGD